MTLWTEFSLTQNGALVNTVTETRVFPENLGGYTLFRLYRGGWPCLSASDVLVYSVRILNKLPTISIEFSVIVVTSWCRPLLSKFLPLVASRQIPYISDAEMSFVGLNRLSLLLNKITEILKNSPLLGVIRTG